jgi:hypothetical protein
MQKGFYAISFILILVLISCKSYQSVQTTPFTFNNAYYQSWMENQSNKGTNVTILLTNVDSGVSFDSLVFRGLKVPVTSFNGIDTTIIRGTVPAQGSITPVKPQYSAGPNQLIFRTNGLRRTFILKNVDRKDMNYFKK